MILLSFQGHFILFPSSFSLNYFKKFFYRSIRKNFYMENFNNKMFVPFILFIILNIKNFKKFFYLLKKFSSKF